MARVHRSTGPVLLAALLLAGCAGSLRVDNDVRSYAAWERVGTTGEYRLPAPGDAYRFDRRPSQEDPRQSQDQALLEDLAREALGQVGLLAVPANDAAQVRWRIEVSARSVRMPHAPWEPDYWPGFGLIGSGPFMGGRGSLMLAPMDMRLATPYYQREISLVIRDQDTGRVVYETQAAHDGPWANSAPMWRALLDAALEGFPIPRAGVRRVPLTIPRRP